MLCMEVTVNWPAQSKGTACFYKHVGCVMPGMANDVLAFGLAKAMQDVPVHLHAELKRQVESAATGHKVTSNELKRLCKDGPDTKPPPKPVKKSVKKQKVKKQAVVDVPHEDDVVVSGPVRERVADRSSPSLQTQDFDSDWESSGDDAL